MHFACFIIQKNINDPIDGVGSRIILFIECHYKIHKLFFFSFSISFRHNFSIIFDYGTKPFAGNANALCGIESQDSLENRNNQTKLLANPYLQFSLQLSILCMIRDYFVWVCFNRNSDNIRASNTKAIMELSSSYHFQKRTKAFIRRLRINSKIVVPENRLHFSVSKLDRKRNVCIFSCLKCQLSHTVPSWYVYGFVWYVIVSVLEYADSPNWYLSRLTKWM